MQHSGHRLSRFLILALGSPSGNLALFQEFGNVVDNSASRTSASRTSGEDSVRGPFDSIKSVFSNAADSFDVLIHERFSPFDDGAAAGLFSRSGLWDDALRLPGNSHSGPRRNSTRRMTRTAAADSRTDRADSYRKNRFLDNPHITTDVGSINFFRSATLSQWMVLVAVCLALLALDSVVFSKMAQNFKVHCFVILCWLIIAVAYDMWVEGSLGNRRAFEWIYGYMLEWMLSMDNLFVFHLVFTLYRTPRDQTHKAVFVGIVCAAALRLVFFLVVATLLHAFGWVRWPIGAILIWSGIGAIRDDDGDDMTAVEDTRVVRCLKWLCGDRLLERYAEKPHLVVFDEHGKWRLTMLSVVVVIIELSDVVFALDSVSAKTAQIPDQYISFSSSILAMFGLRAMFFVIEDLVEMFDLLKYGLGVILIYIGVELMFSNVFNLSKGLTAILILGVFVLCIGGSIAQEQWRVRKGKASNNNLDEDEDEFDPPPRRTLDRRRTTSIRRPPRTEERPRLRSSQY